MTDAQVERLIDAVELLATAVGSMAQTLERTYDKQFPAPRSPRDIALTHPRTEDEERRIDQGETGERTLNEWMTLSDAETHDENTMGPRTRKWDETEKHRAEKERADQGRPHRLGGRPAQTGE